MKKFHNRALLALALLFGAEGIARGQAAVAMDPVGVYLDNEGALRQKETDHSQRLAELRKKAAGFEKDGKTVYISLPRALAEARKCVEAGQPVPDRLLYMEGMVKLTHVFVYPEEGDLVIAGAAEPFDASSRYRPLGRITGRPVLQLDDLVTALRAAGPGKTPARIGCDIVVTPEIAERCAKKLKGVAPMAPFIGSRTAADRIAEAGGLQPIEFFGLAEDSRFAFVCAEADYLLKQLALGLFKPPVAGVKSYNELSTTPGRHHRFSLETQYDALLMSEAGDAFELRGPSLKVVTGLLQRLGPQEGEVAPAAKQFVDLCNKNFEALSREILPWSDLANLGDLSLLSALIARDELAALINWDLTWILDPQGYPAARLPVPKTAHRLCNYNASGGMILFMHGGVWLNPVEWIRKRTVDEKGTLKKPLYNHPEGWTPTPGSR